MASDLNIEYVASPNRSSRRGLAVTGTVIHYTADGPEWNPVRWLCMPEARASAHFVIERDGDVFQLVNLSKKAWHAGHSRWIYDGDERSDVSAYTIGIELANAGLLVRDGDSFFWEQGRGLRPYRGLDPVYGLIEYPNGTRVDGWWEPYPDEQMRALELLLRHIAAKGYEEAAANLVGHEEISGAHIRNSRFKMDPGPAFPWARFNRGPRAVECVVGKGAPA